MNDLQRHERTPTTPRTWQALTVTFNPTDRSLLDALFEEWGSIGTVERELRGSPRTEITAYFPTDAQRAATLECLCRKRLTQPPFTESIAWTLREEPERDWMMPHREHFAGVRVSERVSILPPWAGADHPLAQAPVVLRIDPGMAFGTGTHESTRLALGWLENGLPPGGTVLDLGAGSAILAIAAAKLGASRVVAIEIDPVAEENARGNIARNGVSNQVEYRVCDFTKTALISADVVLCNMLVEEFEPHLARLRDLTRPGGSLILAGLLVADEAAILEGLRAAGLTQFETRADGEWSSVCVRRR